MEMVALLFRQNITMFLYLMVGFFLFKKRLLTSQGSGEIGKMLLYIVMPMAIVRSYMKDFSLAMMTGLLVSFAAALAALLLAMAVSTLIFRKKSAIRQFGASFSNAGFIGITLVQMTLGEEAVFYVA